MSYYEPWYDRMMDRVMEITYWPWNTANGRGPLYKLLVLTVGWVWILPTLIILGGPCMLIAIMAMLWDELDT